MKSTGWPPGLMQDDSRELSRWFASRIDARRCVRVRVKEIEMSRFNTNQEKLYSQVVLLRDMLAEIQLQPEPCPLLLQQLNELVVLGESVVYKAKSLTQLVKAKP